MEEISWLVQVKKSLSRMPVKSLLGNLKRALKGALDSVIWVKSRVSRPKKSSWITLGDFRKMQGLPRREYAEIEPFMNSVAIKEIELDPSEMKGAGQDRGGDTQTWHLLE